MRTRGRVVAPSLVLGTRAQFAAPEPPESPRPRALSPADAAAEVVKAFQGKDAGRGRRR